MRKNPEGYLSRDTSNCASRSISPVPPGLSVGTGLGATDNTACTPDVTYTLTADSETSPAFCSSAPPPSGIDLTASAPSPTSATAGTIIFSSTITNGGTTSTGTGFTNLFQYSASSDGSSPTNFTVSTPSALTGGATTVISKSIALSASTYYMRACADNDIFFNGTIAESNEDNNCSSGTPWTTVTVSPVGGGVTTGTITCTPPYFVGEYCHCTITSGNNSCDADIMWSTTNPPAGFISHLVATGVPILNINANSGGPSTFSIPYNSRTFYLNNNDNQLASLGVISACASGTSWDVGSEKCVSSNGANGSCSSPANHLSPCSSSGGNSPIVSSPSKWTWTCRGSDNTKTSDDVLCSEKRSPGFIEN